MRSSSIFGEDRQLNDDADELEMFPPGTPTTPNLLDRDELQRLTGERGRFVSTNCRW